MTGNENGVESSAKKIPADPRENNLSGISRNVKALLISAIVTFCWWFIMPSVPEVGPAFVLVGAGGLAIVGSRYRSMLLWHANNSNTFYDHRFESIQQGLRMPGSKRFEYFNPLALLLRTLLYGGIALVAVTLLVLL